MAGGRVGARCAGTRTVIAHGSALEVSSRTGGHTGPDPEVINQHHIRALAHCAVGDRVPVAGRACFIAWITVAASIVGIVANAWTACHACRVLLEVGGVALQALAAGGAGGAACRTWKALVRTLRGIVAGGAGGHAGLVKHVGGRVAGSVAGTGVGVHVQGLVLAGSAEVVVTARVAVRPTGHTVHSEAVVAVRAHSYTGTVVQVLVRGALCACSHRSTAGQAITVANYTVRTLRKIA